MTTLNLKPSHTPVKAYYETLKKFDQGRFDNEGNIRGVFEDLLKKCARQFDWLLVPEYRIARKGRNPISIDGTLIDAFHIERAYWEAKDEKDDLEVEMKKKFEEGYPRTNILFQKPTRALLFQDGRIAFNDSITDPTKLVDALRLFFEYRAPFQADWEKAVEEFSDRIPDIAKGAMALIDDEKKSNKRFQERFGAFAELCRESINPDLKDEAVEEMLVQHLLTERIFRKVFNNPEFTRRNVIAAEIEKVIDSLTKKHFSRDAFLKSLDHFYRAIEEAAGAMEDYAEKQTFLNHVYERFFQGFSKKQADTHGIVYTPQPIVDFMVRSVEDMLQSEFGKSLSESGVHILDPFVGTGNFITRVMQEIQTTRLPQKYREELHCNEVMLLPYYIANMNIEHAYLERTSEYEPFQGICLVDTFELARQSSLFSTENAARIEQQRKVTITVVIANPPYNVGQASENDQNKNRRYLGKEGADTRVRATYASRSTATLLSKLGDPYVKAFRWASDRIVDCGIVCFVSNNSFIDQLAFDGMRKCLQSEFSKIYLVDLGGNVHKNPKLSGTTHNVFGIQLGVVITFLVKHEDHDVSRAAEIFYTRMPEDWRKEQKYTQLDTWKTARDIEWRKLHSGVSGTWLVEGEAQDFKNFPPLANITGKDKSIFESYSLGVSTNRDSVVYGFARTQVATKVKAFIKAFKAEVARYISEGKPQDVDQFVNYSSLKWSRNLKRHLKNLDQPSFSDAAIRNCLYRPFCNWQLYLQDILVDEPGQMKSYDPRGDHPQKLICLTGPGSEKPFMALASGGCVDLHLVGPGAGSQCFPFYTYDADGSNCRDNITDWALETFRKHYSNRAITKWDIFHATYAILHHPEYRTRYFANLKRELPRIPFVPDFKRYAEIGADLMKLHVEYENQPEYPLGRTEKGKLDWRIKQMVLSKDKTQLLYNDFLTLRDIPPETHEYRLGNRSALEWIVDQYQTSADIRSGTENDPNRADDTEYIVRLIGQAVTVSIETVKLVRVLASLPLVSP